MRTHISPSALVAAFAVALALLASPANGRSLRSTAAIISTISTTAVDETPSTSNPLVNQDRRRLEYGIDDLIVGYGNETYAYSTSMQYEYNPSGQSSSSVTVTDANMCVTAEGNSWKAIPIPSNATVSTTDKTVLSFQFSYEQVADINAICLDEDTAFATSGQLRCFAVSAAQGWVANMANVPNMAQNANETYTFDIPIGYFAPDITPKYLVIIQDEDDLTSTGTTVSAKSKFCGIHLHEKETFSRLHMKINDEDVYLDNDFKAYGVSTDDDQDSRNQYLHISEDGAGLQVVGNQWKALELPNGGYDITSSTVLDFFFSFKEQVEFSAICLDSDRARTNTKLFSEKRCFQLSGIDGFHSQHHKMPKTEEANQDTQYKIPVGRYFQGNVKWLAIIQDMDRDKRKGISTYHSFQIYEAVIPDLEFEIDGATEMIDMGAQMSYHTGQDSQMHDLVISDNNRAVTLKDNIWRSVQLPQQITITRATQLEFTLDYEEAYEELYFGFDDDLNRDNAKTNFQLTGTKDGSSSHFFKPFGGRTSINIQQPGSTRDYKIPIGNWIIGNYTYLNLMGEQDANGGVGGKATFANFSIYEKPSLNIAIDGTTKSLVNYQRSYDSGQDTPLHNMEVDGTGNSIRSTGNTWKYISLPELMTVTDNTVIAFDAKVIEFGEIHGICLDDNNDHDDERRCLTFGGRDFEKLGSNWIKVPNPISHEKNEVTYHVRIGDFFTGPVDRLVFVQDDDADSEGGDSIISNLRFFEAASCLFGPDNNSIDDVFDPNKDKSFNIIANGNDCAFDKFISGIEAEMTKRSGSCTGVGGVDGAIAELMTYYNIPYGNQVRSKVASICLKSYEAINLPFDYITQKGYFHDLEFFDGGGELNYEHQIGSENSLLRDGGRIKYVHETFASSRAISFPSEMHQFRDCELRAAMCCFVASRQKAPTEDNTSIQCDPANDFACDLNGNSEVCLVDFSNSPQSAHVRDGYSLYGPLGSQDAHCAGFAWGDDEGYAEAALKGNTLFHVAMVEHVYSEGFVEEIPGAPMCGCVEKMPVVTEVPSCTDIEVTQQVIVRFDHTIDEIIAEVNVSSVTTTDCDGKSLPEHYATLSTPGEQEALGKIIVGDGQCTAAIGSFLETKGLEYSAPATSQA
jgi:hypothetical protein